MIEVLLVCLKKAMYNKNIFLIYFILGYNILDIPTNNGILVLRLS